MWEEEVVREEVVREEEVREGRCDCCESGAFRNKGGSSPDQTESF